MSIDTTITFRDGAQVVYVSGTYVSLVQDANGNIYHANHRVDEIESKISHPDSQVTFQIRPNAQHTVEVYNMCSDALQGPPVLPDRGGATWVVAGTGLDITVTAPSILGVKRSYVFDAPPQPAVMLKIRVERT